MNKQLLLLFFLSIFQFVFSQITLLSTDFQSGIPNQYTILDNDGNTPFSIMTEFIGQNAWIVLQDPENPNDSVASATSYFESPDSADRWLITPQINLTSFGNFISWNAKSHDPSFPDDYLVLLSTTDSSPTSFKDTIGSVEQENFEWTNREVNLSLLGYNDSSIYVAFVLRTYDGFKLYLDDIDIRGEDPVGLEEKQGGPAIAVYPNPASEIISIKGLSSELKGEIWSFNGLLIKTFNTKTVGVEELVEGYYYINITSDNQLYRFRFLKK